MGAVDYAIHVLLAAGMSSPTLREIARGGVDVPQQPKLSTHHAILEKPKPTKKEAA